MFLGTGFFIKCFFFVVRPSEVLLTGTQEASHMNRKSRRVCWVAEWGLHLTMRRLEVNMMCNQHSSIIHCWNIFQSASKGCFYRLMTYIFRATLFQFTADMFCIINIFEKQMRHCRMLENPLLWGKYICLFFCWQYINYPINILDAFLAILNALY